MERDPAGFFGVTRLFAAGFFAAGLFTASLFAAGFFGAAWFAFARNDERGTEAPRFFFVEAIAP